MTDVVSAPITLSITSIDAPITSNGNVMHPVFVVNNETVVAPISVNKINISGNFSITPQVVNAPITTGNNNTGETVGTETYTGDAERDIGGIFSGDSFVGATMTEMWDKLIKEEKFPSLSNPSSSFSSSVTGYREIGEVIPTISFDSSFSRGSISPQYTAINSYRSGLPNRYNYSGFGLDNSLNTLLLDSQNISDYTVLIGGQSWSGSVDYDEGVQPKSSYDNNYDIPLSAGTTNNQSRTITGVYPYYGTTSDILTLTKQSLSSMASGYVQIDLVAESGVDKQTVDFPALWSTITGIEFFNTVSNSWEYIGGSKANSLATFNLSITTHIIQGNNISYNKFVHNGALIGARQTRWHTT